MNKFFGFQDRCQTGNMSWGVMSDNQRLWRPLSQMAGGIRVVEHLPAAIVSCARQFFFPSFSFFNFFSNLFHQRSSSTAGKGVTGWLTSFYGFATSRRPVLAHVFSCAALEWNRESLFFMVKLCYKICNDRCHRCRTRLVNFIRSA